MLLSGIYHAVVELDRFQCTKDSYMSHITFRTLHGVRIISLLAIILLFLTATFTVTHPVAADGDRIQVSGTLTTHFISSACTSPLGICEGGTITGNYLNGTVFGQFSSISFIPNETNPTSIEYTGTATITTKFGTLSGDV